MASPERKLEEIVGRFSAIRDAMKSRIAEVYEVVHSVSKASPAPSSLQTYMSEIASRRREMADARADIRTSCDRETLIKYVAVLEEVVSLQQKALFTALGLKVPDRDEEGIFDVIDDTNDDAEDAVEPEEPVRPPRSAAIRRFGVSAEASTDDAKFTPTKVYPKSREQREMSSALFDVHSPLQVDELPPPQHSFLPPRRGHPR
jgi:hypothetical protein